MFCRNSARTEPPYTHTRRTCRVKVSASRTRTVSAERCPASSTVCKATQQRINPCSPQAGPLHPRFSSSFRHCDSPRARCRITCLAPLQVGAGSRVSSGWAARKRHEPICDLNGAGRPFTRPTVGPMQRRRGQSHPPITNRHNRQVAQLDENESDVSRGRTYRQGRGAHGCDAVRSHRQHRRDGRTSCTHASSSIDR